MERLTRRGLRLAGLRAVAGLAAVVVAAMALAVWAVGLGQYLEDYCFTTVGRNVEAGGRGPFLEWPVTVRCEYDNGTTIVRRDVLPATWTAAVIGIGLTAVGAIGYAGVHLGARQPRLGADRVRL